MRWEWILNPALPLGMTGAGLLSCLYLFLSLKREARQRDQAVQAALGELRQQVREAEQASVTPALPLSPPSGLNISKRAQALRLHRRGESAESIAAALAMAKPEVDLLIKVQQVLLEARSPQAPARPRH